jgi:hypothetical protein
LKRSRQSPLQNRARGSGRYYPPHRIPQYEHIGTTLDRCRQDRYAGGIAETGRLGADPGVFKYTVEVTPVAPNPTPPALDPIIIIER